MREVVGGQAEDSDGHVTAPLVSRAPACESARGGRAHSRRVAPSSLATARHRNAITGALGSDGDHATDPPPRPVRSPRDGAGRRPGRRAGRRHGDRARPPHGAPSTGRPASATPTGRSTATAASTWRPTGSTTATRSATKRLERPHDGRADRHRRTSPASPSTSCSTVSKVTVDGDEGALRQDRRRARAADHPGRAAGRRQQAHRRGGVRRPPGAALLRRGAQLAGQQARGRHDERAAHGAVVVPRQRPPARQGDRRREDPRSPTAARSSPTASCAAARSASASTQLALARRRADGALPRVLRRRRLRDREGQAPRPAVARRGLGAAWASATRRPACG